MTEPKTDTELADALAKYTKHLRAQGFNIGLMDEIVQRLRDMPEGERIEGMARERGFPAFERTVWRFSKDGYGTTDEKPATLILHTRKEGDGC